MTAEPSAISKKSRGILLAVEKAAASFVVVPYIPAMTMSRSIPHSFAKRVAATKNPAVSALLFLSFILIATHSFRSRYGGVVMHEL